MGPLVQRRLHVARGDAVDADAARGPLGRERFAELDDAGFGGVVRALLLRVEDAGAGHAGDEDHRGRVAGRKGPGEGAGGDEGPGEVDVDQVAEERDRVGLSFDVGAGVHGVRTRGSEWSWGDSNVGFGEDGEGMKIGGGKGLREG